MAVKHIEEKDFEEEVLKSDKPVVVDFYADWCGPCRMMGPIFDTVSDKYKNKATFVKVDVDKSQKIASEFGVMSIPTLIIFKDGKPMATMTGVQDEDSLFEAIDNVG